MNENEIKEIARATFLAYRDGFVKRYGVRPLKNARVHSIIKSAVRDICEYSPADAGELAPAVMKFFMACDDPYFIKTGHGLFLFRARLNALITKYIQKRDGIKIERYVSVNDALNSHHNFHLKDYSAGLTDDGRLIDYPGGENDK